jgi:hypothetical protein
MSSDSRGRHDDFERLLATAHRGRMPEPSACPDAATVAAYADGALDAGERASFEHHAADCPRCAEAIALLAGLDEVPAAGPTTTRGASWPWWRWLVPVATVLLVFIVWRELPPRDIAGPVSDTSDSMRDETRPTLRDRQASPTRGADGATKAREPGAAAKPLPMAQEQQGKEKEQRGPKQTEGKQEEHRKQAYAAPRSNAHPDSGVAPYAAGPARQSVAGGRPEAITVVPSAPAPPAEADSRAERLDEVLAETAAPVPVTSADRAAMYRVLQGRMVQRSTDAGRTWTTEPTPAVTDLRVGSAPSRDVCWFAGAAGRVLRRGPDGTWQLVPLPHPLEIVGITATSAADALVTAADGTRWRTSDGGKSWEPL